MMVDYSNLILHSINTWGSPTISQLRRPLGFKITRTSPVDRDDLDEWEPPHCTSSIHPHCTFSMSSSLLCCSDCGIITPPKSPQKKIFISIIKQFSDMLIHQSRPAANLQGGEVSRGGGRWGSWFSADICPTVAPHKAPALSALIDQRSSSASVITAPSSTPAAGLALSAAPQIMRIVLLTAYEAPS